MNAKLLSLARAPDLLVTSYKRYIVNGFRFHTRDLEQEMNTQNSRAFVTGETNSYASIKDNNLIVGNVDYFGVLLEIIELHYLDGLRVFMFKCDWIDVFNRGRGIKTDIYGFTCVNFSQFLRTNEPFILASQAQQVFYVKDVLDPNWYVVQKTHPRDLYDMQIEEDEPYQQNQATSQSFSIEMDNCEAIPTWQRTGFTGEIVETHVALKRKGKRKKNDRKKKRKRIRIEELEDEDDDF